MRDDMLKSLLGLFAAISILLLFAMSISLHDIVIR